MMRPLLLCLCLSVAVARTIVREHLEDAVFSVEQKDEGIPRSNQAPGRSVAFLSVFSSVENGAEEELQSLGQRLSPRLKGHCEWMIGIYLIICCCGGLVCSRGFINCLLFVMLLGMLVYSIHSGIWDEWYAGKEVGFSCAVLCWWIVFQTVLTIVCYSCLFCGVGVLLGFQVAIKNALIKQMHEVYEKKKEELSGPRREYFEGDVFKKKCDRLFDKYDTDKNGTLDMSELQPLVEEQLGEARMAGLLAEAFDENHDSVVEKEEFVHMMQYISMLKFKEGQFTEESAWEVLQLDPDTASKDDFKKTYRMLALKYHPDKRMGVAEEVVKRDMAEINDAKALLDKKFSASESERASPEDTTPCVDSSVQKSESERASPEA